MASPQEPQPACDTFDIRSRNYQDPSLDQETATLSEEMSRVFKVLDNFYRCNHVIGIFNFVRKIPIQVGTNAGYRVERKALCVEFNARYVESQI
jgi:hypothetical protein